MELKWPENTSGHVAFISNCVPAIVTLYCSTSSNQGTSLL